MPTCYDQMNRKANLPYVRVLKRSIKRIKKESFTLVLLILDLALHVCSILLLEIKVQVKIEMVCIAYKVFYLKPVGCSST